LSSQKAERKRQLILDRAHTIFSKKGFTAVTMKDIVDACDISRGGLYRYYASTSEIFLEIFQKEAIKEQRQLEINTEKMESPLAILTEYFETQKQHLILKDNNLTMATYEYFLQYPDNQVILKWQFDGIAEMLREVLEKGIKKDEIKCRDAAAMGRHFALFVTNFRLAVAMIPFHEERIEEQIELLLRSIRKEEEWKDTLKSNCNTKSLCKPSIMPSKKKEILLT